MLAKLYKYDMKALSQALIPITIAVAVVTVITCVAGCVGYYTDLSDSLFYSSSVKSTLQVSAFLVALVGFLTMLMAPTVTLILVIRRFYQNLFTDEGYLSFTLPVSAHQHMLSKILSGFTWILITYLVVFLGSLLASLSMGGFVDSSADTWLPLWVLNAAAGNLFSSDGWSMFLGLLNIFFAMLLSLLVAYAAFTLGATIAARHKVAVGIVLYVGFIWVYETAVGVVAVLVATVFAFDASADQFTTTTTIASVIGWVLSLAAAAGCYALCVHLLGRKLNLA